MKFTLIDKLKDRWRIKSSFQLLIIFLVFGITGSMAVWISNPILDFIHLKQESLSLWAYWPVRIIVIFPLYQALLLIIGTLFGEFEFFKNFIKKMLARLRLIESKN